MTAAPPAAPPVDAAPATATAPAVTTAHRRRLRELWRSAGWPMQDPLEAELLALGLLSRERDGQGRETLRVTDAGVAVLAQTLQRNRAARDAHEALVARVARELQRGGRVVWRGLTLRARVGEDPVPRPDLAGPQAVSPHPGPEAPAMPVATASGPALPASAAADDGRWAMVMPDVYSIRHTTVEDWLQPVVHEIKVRRADLLSDLRKPHKGEAYRWLSAECWYVIAEGIAQADEIPAVYGVLVAPRDGGALQVARPAPQRAMRPPFMVWMALARAAPEPCADEGAQLQLGAPADAGDLGPAGEPEDER